MPFQRRNRRNGLERQTKGIPSFPAHIEPGSAFLFASGNVQNDGE
jgi:hypothetical protein